MSKPIRESISKAIVINEKNEALILTVGEYKERPDKAFKPDLPGGIVDPGETSLIAVHRELQEEAGITADIDKFELAYARTEFFAAENKSVTKFLYLIRLDSMPEVTISWEHASYEWVPVDGILDRVELRRFYKEAVEYCVRHRLI